MAIIQYAVESAEDQDGNTVAATVTFEFDDIDSDDKLVGLERQMEISREILHDGRTSSTTLL